MKMQPQECPRLLQTKSTEDILPGRRSRLIGWRTQAAQVLRKGLRIDPGNKKLLAEINRVSPRTPNTIQGLPRNHPVNRYLGKLRSELSTKEKPRIKPKTSPTYS